MAGNYVQAPKPVTTLHSNLDQNVIQITEDRLRLVLKEHIELAVEKKTWVAPLGLLLAIITTFVTADFRNFIFDAAVWQAVFLMTGLFSVTWLVKTLYCAVMAPSLDDIVEKIKNGTKNHETNSWFIAIFKKFVYWAFRK